MGKKRRQKKKTASVKKQSFSFKPLICGHISEGQRDYVLNEQIKVLKTRFGAIYRSENRCSK